MFSKISYSRIIVVLLTGFFVASCTNSKITTSWVSPEQKKVYQHILVIGVSDSQQTRRIFEKYFVSSLQKRGVHATPSYELINSKQKMNKETVKVAIKDTDIDAVIVTYLIAADAEMKYHESLLNAGYSGNVESSQVSATMISTRGRTSSTEIVSLKNDLYDVASVSIVWSTQTRTTAPESIDEVVTEISELLTDKLINDKILKQNVK